MHIDKRELSPEVIERIKQELTLSNPKYEAAKQYSRYGAGKINEENVFYQETSNKLLLPRNFPIPKNVDLTADETVAGLPAFLRFKGKLRDYQADFLATVEDTFFDTTFEVPCGHGKTTMAIYQACKFNVKTIVLLPTNYLLNQWIDRVTEYVGKKPFVITNEGLRKSPKGVELISYINSIVSNNDIYLLSFDMLLSITTTNNIEASISRQSLDQLLNSIGFCILDEAHRVGATTYMEVMQHMRASRRLALTATFRRKDNREKILQYHFGETFSLASRFPPALVYPYYTNVEVGKLLKKSDANELLVYKLVDYGIKCTESANYYNINLTSTDVRHLSAKNQLSNKDVYLLNKPVVFADIDNYVCEVALRNKQIFASIQLLLESGRTVLVLSKRKQILKKLHLHFSKNFNSALVVSETNKLTPEERKNIADNAQLICGIMQLAQEGLDIERIDTIFFIHPVEDTEQAIGRSSRILPGKKQSLVFYPVDSCKSYQSIFSKAAAKYIPINAQLKNVITHSKLKDLIS